ncbi:23S rRNA pseudouridine1911/1915/1917 synthase [Caminicella sporogenes DSM 14501]|uniref:Pseudouridine synthase n=1 Tax=Caminicella sporogenes DSM 14501 TaxID=1121266 RepID=A0A1M6LJ35_9FIRM|nr:RluA family pseudouridine synthase [Caminicella sporogenes]RKD27846.1 RNA pseudouridine synthase [Caminicella sporogenes]SHJ71172.1 23S rRNA pseudouridine1911/1915/1917 synthase [Caminicella sporogenes DSM 14501]
MEVIRLLVEDIVEPTRVDLYLSRELNDISRSYIQKLIKSGKVKVNGEVIESKKYKVNENDEIHITIPEPEKLKLEPENIPIDIVYEDDDVLVVNKPQGMVVHPAPGHYSKTLVNALLYHCNNLSSINGIIRPGIVHRIDKDTSGLLMIAKNDRAHNFLAKQLKEHSITRIYMAVVHGKIKEDSGTIDAPIGRHPVNRLKWTVTENNSKRAVTHFEVVKRYKNYTLVKLKLETGRTHQIRVHMSYIGYPLVGDPLYGIKKEKFNLKGQVLHAKKLGFIHPSTLEYIEFDSQLPTYFKEILRKIELIS